MSYDLYLVPADGKPANIADILVPSEMFKIKETTEVVPSFEVTVTIGQKPPEEIEFVWQEEDKYWWASIAMGFNVDRVTALFASVAAIAASQKMHIINPQVDDTKQMSAQEFASNPSIM